MSAWSTQHLEARIVEVLGDVEEGVEGHHFGRPFLTAYQLAIRLDRRYPEIRQALGMELGGEGIGVRNRFAQYLAQQLSQRIHAEPDYPIEGRMLSNADVGAIEYTSPSGEAVRSSLTGSGYDLSMYRLR